MYNRPRGIAQLTDDDKPEQTIAPRQAFAFSEMVRCDVCLRANAPNRRVCLYCSATLPGMMAGTEDPAPARTNELVSADVLSALGVQSGEVNQQELDLAKPPRRIRALEFSDSITATITGSNEKLTVSWAEVILLVTGRLQVNRVEIEQSKSRRNRKPAERREVSSDEVVLDIYTGNRDGGWRISAGSFDFSCLGEAKGPLATENFSALINAIRARAMKATFDDQYATLRKTLTAVWPVEPRSETGGWRRAGAGKYLTTSATISDNEAQFTRYSRLRHYLRRQERDKSK